MTDLFMCCVIYFDTITSDNGEYSKKHHRTTEKTLFRSSVRSIPGRHADALPRLVNLDVGLTRRQECLNAPERDQVSVFFKKKYLGYF